MMIDFQQMQRMLQDPETLSQLQGFTAPLPQEVPVEQIPVPVRTVPANVVLHGDLHLRITFQPWMLVAKTQEDIKAIVYDTLYGASGPEYPQIELYRLEVYREEVENDRGTTGNIVRGDAGERSAAVSVPRSGGDGRCPPGADDRAWESPPAATTSVLRSEPGGYLTNGAGGIRTAPADGIHPDPVGSNDYRPAGGGADRTGGVAGAGTDRYPGPGAEPHPGTGWGDSGEAQEGEEVA